MLYPVRFVGWGDVVEWCWRLSRMVVDGGFRPDVVVAVGRGGFVAARLLCDFLDVSGLLAVPIRWVEVVRRPGERYLADLIRAWVRSLRGCGSIEEGISDVVSRLRVSLSFDYDVDLRGKRALLVEEIVVTGFHMSTAKEIVEGRWLASEVKTATLVWKSTACKLKPDYHVIETRDFVWFQFPWSRLDDYKQFVRVMLLEASREEGKAEWSMDEIKGKFREWYGSDPDLMYLKEAIEALMREGLLKPITDREFRVTSTME